MTMVFIRMTESFWMRMDDGDTDFLMEKKRPLLLGRNKP